MIAGKEEDRVKAKKKVLFKRDSIRFYAKMQAFNYLARRSGCEVLR